MDVNKSPGMQKTIEKLAGLKKRAIEEMN